MLTFSEALTQLKAGEDMRWLAWPAGQFLRAVAPPTGPKLMVITGTTKVAYTYPSAEVFGQDWRKA